MKLKLIALAVSAAAAGAVSAQTANVTLYGLVDTYVANVRTSAGRTAAGAATASASVSVVDPGGLSGSRWGLRGSESLGGGLNAVFTLEGGINSDAGSAAQSGLLFGRQAFVGVSGGFGAVTLGRQYSPSFYVFCAATVESCSTFSVEANHYVLPLTGASRVNNSVNFKSASMGGLTVAAMYGFGEIAGGASRGRLVGFNGEFSNGPIYLGAALVDVKNATGGLAGRHMVVGGRYNAGVATVAGAYVENKNPAPTPKFKGWHLGVNVPMGNVGLVAQYGQGKVGAAKQNLFGVGADYNLSKRSNLYVRYANADNNAASNINAAGFGGVAQSFGADKRIIAAGIRHRF